MSADKRRWDRKRVFAPTRTILEGFPELGIPEVKCDDAHRLWGLRPKAGCDFDLYAFEEIEKCSVIEHEEDSVAKARPRGLKALAQIMIDPRRASHDNWRRKNLGKVCDAVVVRVTVRTPDVRELDIPIWNRPLKRGGGAHRNILESASMVQESFAHMMSGEGNDQADGDKPF